MPAAPGGDRLATRVCRAGSVAGDVAARNTDFADAVRVAAEARGLLDELGYTGFPKTSGGRGVHIYVRIEPRWTFTDVGASR